MRVLLVSHDFLPAYPAGTEIYTAQVGAALLKLGHEVELFTTERNISQRQATVNQRRWDGIHVHELVNNRFYDAFQETWDWPPADRAFARVLDTFKPDVVHIMHLLYLSVGCAEEAHRRGILIFFTLHDFWLQCPRATRLAADSSLCHSIDFDRCGRCLADFPYAHGKHSRRALRFIADIRESTGLDLGPLARRTIGFLDAQRRPLSGPVEANAHLHKVMAAAAATRTVDIKRRLVPLVEKFFVPSRFLCERFVEWGLVPERIEHLTYGIDLRPYSGFRREPSDTIRVAFLGTVAPNKGPHLLLEAWTRIPEGLRQKARLTLYGPLDYFPEYVAELKRAATSVGASLPGIVAPDLVPQVYREVDLLVVPSVWFENSPLVILQAIATRTPLLVSDIGGMTELVHPGRHGWRFRAGDPEDLARKLESVLVDPSLLERLDWPENAVKNIDTHAAELAERYRSTLSSRPRTTMSPSVMSG